MDTYIKQAENFIKLGNEALLETPPDYGKNEEFFKKAISFYEKELIKTPSPENINFEIGKTCLLLKDKMGACQDFEVAMNLGHSGAKEMYNNYCKQ